MPVHALTSITRHPLRLMLLLLAALIAALLLLGTALVLFWSEDDLRQRIEKEASEYLMVPVKVGGEVSLRLLPRPALRVTDVMIGAESGSDAKKDAIGHLASAGVTLRWLPLLRGRLAPGALHLDNPVLRLERDASGVLNFDLGPERKATGHGRAQFDLHIREGEVYWKDHDRGRTAAVTGLEVSLSDLQWQSADDGRHPLSRSSLSMVVSADTVSLNALTFSDVAFRLTGQDGEFSTDGWEMTLFESNGSGQLKMDFSDTPTSWALNLEFDELLVGALPEDWLPAGDTVSGSAALLIALTSHGDDFEAMIQHLSGDVRLSGRDLRLKGVDLDKELSQYKDTQRFSLVDAAAVIVAGPAWLAVTKGSEFMQLMGSEGGETDILQFISEWEIKDGTAHARDVAMATRHNRLAARASLDLPARKIDDAVVAVVNRDGCVVIRQAIHGTFDAPVIEKPNMVESLLGAPLNLLQRGLDALSVGEDECEDFYQGAVEAPKSDG